MHQLRPVHHVTVVIFEVQDVEDFTAQTFVFEGERYGVDAVGVQGGDDRSLGHTAEASNFAFELIVDVAIAATDEQIWLDSDRAQLFDRMLGGLGFEFSRCADKGEQGHVDVGQISSSHISSELSNGFQEGQRLNITNSSADFGNHNIGIAIGGHTVNAVADFTGDMGDDLNGPAVVTASSLLINDGLIDRAGGHAVEARHGGVGEAFVVAEIKIGFGTVFSDKHLPVLKRAHRSWVHIQIGIQLQD